MPKFAEDYIRIKVKIPSVNAVLDFDIQEVLVMQAWDKPKFIASTMEHKLTDFFDNYYHHKEINQHG